MVARRVLRFVGVAGLLTTIALVAPSLRAQTLTADEAVRQAARHNPSLRAALHDVAAARADVRGEDDARVPTLFAGVQGQVAERFSGSSRGITRNVSRAVSGNAGVRYTTPIGTDLEVGVEPSVSWQTSNINVATTESVTIGPHYTAELYAAARQPLLRGAGTDVVLAPLRQAELRQTQAEAARDEAASQLVVDVLSAYWELWYAQQAISVQLNALALAEQQLQDTKLRAAELGTVPQTDVLQFSSQVASIREHLLEAQTTRRTNAVELGRLLGMPPARAAGLTAAGSPTAAPALPPIEQLARRARQASAELRALHAQVDAARDRMVAADDDDQPRLDLIAQGSMGGLWAYDGLSGLELPGGRPAFAALVGLELELPLGPSRASATLSRTRAEMHAAEARLEAREEAIEAEVAALHIRLQSAAELVALASESAGIAAALAEAERQRLELGIGLVSELVEAQQAQRETELRRLRAIVSQAVSRFQLEHRVALLLEAHADAFAEEDR